MTAVEAHETSEFSKWGTNPRGYRAGLAVTLAMSAALRWRVLDAPLQRDEGEYAYAGQLLLDGVAPYVALYNMKLPGMYAAYAAVMSLFGETARGVHLGLVVVNALAIVLVYAIGRQLLGERYAFAAALVFSVASMLRGVQGVFANAEHFLLVPVLAALWWLLRAGGGIGWRGLLGAGLLLGTGVLLKQQGVVFAVFGGLFAGFGLWRASIPIPRIAAGLAVFSLGVATPVLAAALLLAIAGVFEAFWLWTVEYAWAYTGHMNFEGGLSLLSIFGTLVLASAPALFALALGGVVAVWFDRELRGRAGFLLVFLGFSLAAVAPGLNFRPHYFLLALPAVALLAAALLEAIARFLAKRIGVAAGTSVAGVLLLGASGATLLADPVGWREISPAGMTRVTFGWRNPFVESQRIAQFIERLAAEGDRIAVFGSEPQICFYAGLRCATGFIYMYPLMEEHGLAGKMQAQMIEEVEASDPDWFVYVDVPESWLDSSSFKPITRRGSQVERWFQQRRRTLDRVFLAELSREGPRYVAGPSLRGHRGPSDASVLVYRKAL